jgi:hypothetical protein
MHSLCKRTWLLGLGLCVVRCDWLLVLWQQLCTAPDAMHWRAAPTVCRVVSTCWVLTDGAADSSVTLPCQSVRRMVLSHMQQIPRKH